MTSKERAALRAKANPLEPIIQIGKEGISENLLTQIDDTLDNRELIKIRVHLESAPESPKELAQKLSEPLGAEVIQVIGGIIVLYREADEERIAEKKKKRGSGNSKATAKEKKKLKTLTLNTTDLNIMADKQKIGVFGGAFNPVHNGHINLALHYLNELELDKILFIPTASPPHKSDDDFAPKEDRINMLSLAISSFDKFEISDIEFKLTGKSYTYLTLSELKKIYKNAEFYLIIGADQMLHFDKWYKYKEILSLVTLCTSARENEKEKAEILSFASRLDGLDMNKFKLLTSPVLKVSSSEIRQKIKDGEDFSSLVPKKVYDYIIKRRIYNV